MSGEREREREHLAGWRSQESRPAEVPLREMMSDHGLSFNFFFKKAPPKPSIMFITAVLRKAFLDTQRKDEMFMQNIWLATQGEALRLLAWVQ